MNVVYVGYPVPSGWTHDRPRRVSTLNIDRGRYPERPATVADAGATQAQVTTIAAERKKSSTVARGWVGRVCQLPQRGGPGTEPQPGQPRAWTEADREGDARAAAAAATVPARGGGEDEDKDGMTTMESCCDCGCDRDHKDPSLVEGPSGCVLCNWCSCRCHWPSPEVTAARRVARRERERARKRRRETG